MIAIITTYGQWLATHHIHWPPKPKNWHNHLNQFDWPIHNGSPYKAGFGIPGSTVAAFVVAVVVVTAICAVCVRRAYRPKHHARDW